MRFDRLLFLAVGLLALGCSSSGIKPATYVRGGDAGALAGMVTEYNTLDGVQRILGTLKLEGAPEVSVGGRAMPGVGARLDGMAKSSAKLLFSLGCRRSAGCEVFFPDEFVVYRVEGGVFADWVSNLLTGRVALLGEPVEAGLTAFGDPVVRYENPRGEWQLVLLDRENKRPREIFYGDAAKGATLKVVFSDWFEVAGRPFPGRTLVTGSESGQDMRLTTLKVESGAPAGEDGFRLRVPEGAAVRGDAGRDTWKKMGMFWIPEN